MKILLIVLLAFLSSCLFNTLAFALSDRCIDIEQKSDLDLNEAECYVLERVEKGEVANLEEMFPNKKDRVLEAKFLEKLLTGKLPSLTVTEEGVRIRNAHVSNNFYLVNARIPFYISLSGCIFEGHTEFYEVRFSAEVNFINAHFLDEADFASVRFSAGANFNLARFSAEVNFMSAKFSDGADFGGARFLAKANFIGAQFSGVTDFGGAQFSGVTYFGGAEFSGKAYFGEAKFSGEVSFSGDKFSGEVSFNNAKFSGEVSYEEAKFSGEASFVSATFSGRASFVSATFSGEASFSKATFLNETDFSSCRFKEPVNFSFATFSPDKIPHIKFSDVTGFSNMQMEWIYDPVKFREVGIYFIYLGDLKLLRRDGVQKRIERRGLKNYLKYNETFFIALIKNYRDMGWFTEADDCYYTYRKEKRKRRSLVARIPEWLFLESTFGYGVKPWILLRTFLIFWILPSFIYLRFISYKDGIPLPGWWFSEKKIFRIFRLPWILFQSRFCWALIHSLDTLTPGVTFKSLETLNPYGFDSKKAIYVERVHLIVGWYLLALFLILFSRVWIR